MPAIASTLEGSSGGGAARANSLPEESLQWALAGFSNGTVRLVFGALMQIETAR